MTLGLDRPRGESGRFWDGLGMFSGGFLGRRCIRRVLCRDGAWIALDGVQGVLGTGWG